TADDSSASSHGSSGQASPRHPPAPAYGCFLPDLTGFAGWRRAGPDLQRSVPRAAPDHPGLGRGFSPARADCGYRAPLPPHLARSTGDVSVRAMSVGVIGLGYVGLPLAVAFAEAGENVVAVDVDLAKIEALGKGESYIEDIDSERLRAVLPSFQVDSHYAPLAR